MSESRLSKLKTVSKFEPLLLQSANFLEHLLPNVKLRDYQVRAAIHIAIQDYQLLAFDTGLGKTVAMLAGLVAKKNYGIPVRALILCPLAGMEQVYNSINKFTDFKAVKLTGSEKGLNKFIHSLDESVDILLCNYEAFDNPKVLKVMHYINNMAMFNTIVLDEAHTIANIHTSNRNFFIATLVRNMRFKYFLTATPIISEINQYATLIALMKDELDELGSLVSRARAGYFSHERVPHMVQFKERELGYKVKLYKFPEVKYTGTSYGTEIFKYTRGPESKQVEKKLKDIITNTDGKLLIYSHLKANHKYLADLAESLGRKVGIISGDTSKSDVQERFNKGELDCVVFSIPTELNLPAKAIVLYDWTSMAHQAIGRGIRSESADGYVAHIFLTKTEKEVSLFNNTVIKNSVYLSQAFGKQITELLKLK